MMPVRIEGANAFLGVDKRAKAALHVRIDPVANTLSSAWQPTPAEQRAIAAGASVRLRVAGTAHPPVWLDVGTRPEPVSSLAPADCPLCRSARAHEAPRATMVTHVNAGPHPDDIRRAALALTAAISALNRFAEGGRPYGSDTIMRMAIRDMNVALEGIKQ